MKQKGNHKKKKVGYLLALEAEVSYREDNHPIRKADDWSDLACEITKMKERYNYGTE